MISFDDIYIILLTENIARIYQIFAREDGSIDYIAGAGIGGFVKVADAMLAQDLV